jgi:uncharacterized protein (TIGR03086 family)
MRQRERRLPVSENDDIVAWLERAFVRAGSILDRIGAADYGRPTPCEEWSLGDLLGHVIGSAEAFAVVLEGGPTPAPARVELTDDVRAQYASAAERSVAGWKVVGALEREYDSVIELDGGIVIPPIPLPGRMLAGIQLLDVGVHGFDLADSIGRRDLAADDHLAAATLREARSILQPGIRELVGFGAEQTARPSASSAERLLAFTGRLDTP